ncbi:MAG: OstA-like protein [Gemmatimonadota bacterium]
MRAIALAIALVMAGTVQLDAQGQSCDLADSRQSYSVGGGAVIYIGGPVFRCNTGTTILADSAVYVQATGRIDFIGNVRFDEAERTLTSQYAQYIGRERRLMAQQNVLLTNKQDGSTLRALSLDYLQKSPSNPEARIDVHSGRPRATLYRKRQGTSVIDTTIVDADRMQIVGENVFRGWGSVDVKRGDLTSKSGYAEFDQDGSYMRLYGLARVVDDTMTLSADSIDADMINSDEFKEIRARRDATLEAEAVNVDAPRLRIMFDSAQVTRMIAVGGKRISEAAAQATSRSQDFTLIADSIDAKTPAQKIDMVIAVGAALGERTPDSLDATLPELIAKDWVRGDTVQAFFGTDTTTANPDSARVLERIVAKGAPASSTYRLREQVNDSTEISVNYLTAKMIDVIFKNGEVDHVRAEGEIRGIYLQPPRRAENAR